MTDQAFGELRYEGDMAGGESRHWSSVEIYIL